MVSTSPHPAARAAIQAAGLRHQDVAAHLGIDASKLSKSLSGVRRFNQTELERLADLTGVSVESLRPAPDAHTGAPNPRISGEERAQRKRAIVDVAWPLFTERGYATVTIAEIARAAGMSTPAVHYYFKSKNEIFLATLELCSQQAAKRRSFVADIADPAQRLLRFAEIQLDGSPESKREWTTWAQFWASSPSFPDVKEATAVAYNHWQQQLRTIVVEGQAAGRFDTANPDDMVNAVTAMMDGLGVRILAGVLTPEAAIDAVTTYLNTWIKEPDAPLSSAPTTATITKENG
nr:TetR family transcriptional regulator [Streptococcus thermophilus]